MGGGGGAGGITGGINGTKRCVIKNRKKENKNTDCEKSEQILRQSLENIQQRLNGLRPRFA